MIQIYSGETSQPRARLRHSHGRCAPLLKLPSLAFDNLREADFKRVYVCDSQVQSPLAR